MGLKLTGLDELFDADKATDGDAGGKPLMLSVKDIEPDPKQPRKRFKPGALEEIAADIRRRGVISPISVQPKNEAGKYVLNYGERRWRGSIMAGKDTIPAIIKAEHDRYAQMAENIHRDDLSPQEIGNWIVERLDAGERQVDIAENLGKGKNWVSLHVKIGRAAQNVQEAFEKCSDYTAMADLVDAYKEFPEEATAFFAGLEQIGRKDVQAFLDRCKNPSLSVEEKNGPATSSPTDSTQAGPAASEDSGRGNDANPTGQGEGQGGQKENSAATAGSPSTERKDDADSGKTNSGGMEGKQNSGEVSPASMLASVYAEQTSAKKPVEAVFADMDEATFLKVYRYLSKIRKEGESVSPDALPLELAKRFAAGEFRQPTGVYAMLAFVDGVMHQGDEFTAERMKLKCFGAIEEMNRSQE